MVPVIKMRKIRERRNVAAIFLVIAFPFQITGSIMVNYFTVIPAGGVWGDFIYIGAQNSEMFQNNSV